MKKLKLFTALLAMTGFLLVTRCNKNSYDPKLSVSLTDSPGEFEALHLDVLKVSVMGDKAGWIDLDTKADIYDVLKLNNGIAVNLASGNLVNERIIAKVKLTIGLRNDVVIDGVLHHLLFMNDLQVKSLEVIGDANYEAGMQRNNSILLDLDAAQSVIEKNGTFFLDPVLRVFDARTEGFIKGLIMPVQARPAVMAQGVNDAAGASPEFTTYASPSGEFLLRAQAGVYNVTFDAHSPFRDKMVKNITVKAGETADLGKILFFSLEKNITSKR